MSVGGADGPTEPTPWSSRELLTRATRGIGANLLALVVSTAVTLLFPRLLGVEGFSYWQLYVFYLGYVGFFQLGLNDGILLRIGGKSFDALEAPSLNFQFWALGVTQLVLGGLVAAWAWNNGGSSDRLFVLYAVAVGIPVLGLRWFCAAVLQATGRVNQYVLQQVTESIVFIMLAAGVGLREGGVSQYIFCDLIAKSFSLAVGVIACQGVIIRPVCEFRWLPSEYWWSVKAGISLMIANIMGILGFGVVRFAVERYWSLIQFGMVSLALSITNLLTVFFNTVGMVLFPQVRRLRATGRTRLYLAVRSVYVVAALMLILLEPLLGRILVAWLPSYENAFEYLALILPLLVFEGKTSFLVNPFLKAFRMERRILISNGTALLVAVVFTGIAVNAGNLDMAVSTVLAVSLCRGVVSEMLVYRRISPSLVVCLGLEVVAVLFFLAWVLSGYHWAFLILYLAAVLMDIAKQRDGLRSVLGWLRVTGSGGAK